MIGRTLLRREALDELIFNKISNERVE